MSDTQVRFARNFDTLLLDSIHFLFEAKHAKQNERVTGPPSRASITFSLLLLEAAANVCLEHLDLQAAVHGEIDRLPVLAKFDFYLRTRFRGRCLDRGNAHVEQLRELKAIRDRLVHLKPQKVSWIGDDDTGYETTPTRTQSMSVATNPEFWHSDDAIKVAIGVHGFLAHFFKEKCRYSPKKVSSLLFSESNLPGDDNHFYPHLTLTKKGQLMALGLDITYMKIAWAFSDA